MDFVDDVDAVDHEGRVTGESKGDMKDGPIFRDVDVLAREHGVAMLFDVRFSG